MAGSASVRPTGSSLGLIRLGAQEDKIWFGWRIGVPAAAFVPLTFSEAAARADALTLASIEGSSAQIVSPEIPKKLDYGLLRGERTAVRNRLIELNLRMPIYRAETMPADEESRRKLFTFSKELGIDTVIASLAFSEIAALDKIANETGVNLAIETKDDIKGLLKAVEGASSRIGICVDLDAVGDSFAAAKGRLMAVRVRQNSTGVSDFFATAFRARVRPLYISVEGANPAGVDSLETALHPAMALRVAQVVDSPAGKIRGPELLSPEMRHQIDAAVPREPIVKPKKQRRLLVVDLQMYSGHSSIPHGNLMLELMAKYTGAFEPTFSNDLSNLKYPKIAQYDAIYLNNVCGMVFPDPEVRASILRFVREGGGIGGHHAVTFSNNDWPEFMEMFGAWAGAHHTESQVLKIDDTSSPLTAMFGGQSFEHTDEFYHMPPGSPYSREKQHVLLSIDVPKSDMATGGRFCRECTRPDQDYAFSWIKRYGKGRVFCTPLGHTEVFYTSPQWEKHMLAAVQYMLGDLDAEDTPSARLKSK